MILAAGAGDQLEEIADQWISYKGLTYRGVARQDDADDEEAVAARERFVIAESEALLHHASETLLRLCLAHEAPDGVSVAGHGAGAEPGQVQADR